MTNPFASAIALAAGTAPMGAVPITPNRILLVDGDGLAYYCAGKDDTDAGEARRSLVRKVKSAAEFVGAERIVVLLTASNSHKGHRYAIARVKPYQGQRAGSRRPKNWEALRNYMESPEFPFEVDSTTVAEADDLFGWYSHTFTDVVIYTQDKDMRMLPGLHLDWVTNRVHKVEVVNGVVQDSVFNDKQYGHKWFWLQMLHGDTADHIPGLPLARMKYGGGPIDCCLNLNKVGEAGAVKLLATAMDGYANLVACAYASYYEDRWLVELMEQACLLWMRRKPEDWDDCMNPGGPLECFNDGEEGFARAYLEIKDRVSTADAINQAQS